MSKSFAHKLRLIMRATGCETQKALYSRLKLLNPETGYDPVRAYKWTQGRSSPRNQGVYEDLARLLELDVTGETLRTCSYEWFYNLLSDRYGEHLPPLELEVQVPLKPAAQESALPEFGDQLREYLSGRYYTLSRAWSPHRPGTLISGFTTLSRASDGQVAMEYLEHLSWGDLRLTGTAHRIGRNLNGPLVSSDVELAITFTYAIPPAPGAVLAGVMSGVTMSDAEMRPIATRVLSLRLPEGFEEAEESCYFGSSEKELAERLINCGISDGLAADLAPDILEFLLDPGDQGVIDAPISTINALIGKFLGQS